MEPTAHSERSDATQPESLNFIETIVEDDLLENKYGKPIHTRFPPEPNGYLHIGHAKSICLNFGLAHRYDGLCNLRFDDTNPTAEEDEYVQAIKRDIRWLGFDWGDREYYASDYFHRLYELAEYLIREGKAYIDDTPVDEIRRQRGTPTQPGEESASRNRPREESIRLFERMRHGEFPEGSYVLRAKIDMASPNMHLRDPILYRILHTPHHRTGKAWNIYPTYDWAHGQSDAFESITHSLCTLEFEVHRPLYDWFLDQLPSFEPRPRQIEFARLNLTYTVMSKRKLLALVQGKHVSGWDDPRMPTIAGMRRRGYTPAAIRNFAERVGVAKRNSMHDLSLLEFAVREDLNQVAPRMMAVLDPVELLIENWEEGRVEMLTTENNPEDPAAGEREMPFGRVLYIEREDFMEDPPKKYFRLAPGRHVRLKSAYIVECTGFERDADGSLTRVRANYVPASRSGDDTSGIKAKGTIHWISAQHAIDADVRLYDRLFSVPEPDEVPEGGSFLDHLNQESLHIARGVKLEPALAGAKPGERFQFLRMGYFCVDEDSSEGALVFNRTVTLRDNWAKIAAKG